MKLFLQFSITLLLFLSICNDSFSQNYNSIFGIENTNWKMPFCNLDIADVKEQMSEVETVINGLNYKKVGTVTPNGVFYDLNGFETNGFTREDVSSGKAWFMSTMETILGMDTLEFLVMDLSLNIGDTFMIHKPWNDVITSIIDSVYFISGVKHVQTDYHFWGSSQPLTFIEGIGTNYGLSYMHDSFNMCRCLISINKDFDEVYSNNNCFPPMVGNEHLMEDFKTSIFPNPVSTYLTVESNLKSVQDYAIYSILGEKVMSGRISSNRIDISGLPSSSYILRIGDQSFKLFVTK